ncbi:hypothetical protein An02g00430 [Aspergillus niger]|uniref:Uncharacterized protein n=2 Tax=Aspergillus niger TaxID=5061 RepID=A2QBL1_ASPNC|nr:hypothetical protein An02g00430 [Aspergillus niger]CAK96258.1 hypothetical protein An02g00430 [Aspergillus niger]
MDVIRNCDKPQRSMRALASLHISRTFQMLQWSQYVIKASYSCFALYARGRIGSHSLGSPFWNYGTFMRWYARGCTSLVDSKTALSVDRKAFILRCLTFEDSRFLYKLPINWA